MKFKHYIDNCQNDFGITLKELIGGLRNINNKYKKIPQGFSKGYRWDFCSSEIAFEPAYNVTVMSMLDEATSLYSTLNASDDMEVYIASKGQHGIEITLNLLDSWR